MLNTELEVLKFWKEQTIFEKSVNNRKTAKPFVFFDGPPFATGLPHWGHIMVSQIKDTVLRYQTQNGHYVPRRWGWDCHGAPIEVLAEKKLEIRDKRQIEAEIGIHKFNDYCRSTVMMYDEEWRKAIERIGRWVDMDDQYRTMDNDFIESTWWGLGQLWNKGLLYKDYRISMYSPSVGVPLTHTDVAMEVKYENETIETPVVRFMTQGETIKKLLDKIINHIDTNYSEQFKFKNELQQKAYNLANPGVKKATKDEILKNGFVEFDALKWENFKTSEEVTKEIQEEIQPQLVVLNENLKTLEQLKKYLTANYPVNILAWTTTPWTLPANVALAVGPEIEYSLFYIGATSEIVIVAENLAKIVLGRNLHTSITSKYKAEEYADSGEYFADMGVEIIKLATLTGLDLENIEYKPLFKPVDDFDNDDQKNNAFRVYCADYVSLEDGTGVVHIAPAYGEEDFAVRKARNLPVLTSVNEHGELRLDLDEALTPAFGKKFLSANDPIIQILETQGNLFSKYKHTHRVAVYGRDGKKVYYCAQEGWYIAETKLTERSVQLNNDINWHPESLKLGRFKNGLETAPDWCISRNRYWGNPIPIWQNQDKTKTVFVDSLEKLSKLAINPIYSLITTRDLTPELYENGQTVIVTDAGHKLPLGINATQFRSKNIGDLGKTKKLDINTFAPIAQRILEEVLELFEKYKSVQLFLTDDEKTLWTTWLLTLHPNSKKTNDLFYFYKAIKMGNLDWEPTGSVKILDLHRPFIDEIILKADGEVLMRITEVLDCWVESGSMPHASVGFPFAGNKNRYSSKPQEIATADWICESQDQTRGWFRALHVMSTGIFNKSAFHNINCNGLIMASDGRKMSKSLNNYADPNLILDKFGADAVRLYVLSSPVVNAESMNFSERNLEIIFRESTLLIANSLQFINFVFANHTRSNDRTDNKYTHPLNKWWQSRTQQFVNSFIGYMNDYNIADAARLVTPYINDFSTWYIRRSKDLLDVCGNEVADCLMETMTAFAQSVACIQPFNAEKIWSVIRTTSDMESVHLTDLPKTVELSDKQTEILSKMATLQDQIAQIHSVRKAKNIRVRQPLYADLIGLNLDHNWKEILLKECNLLSQDLSKTEGETHIGTTDIGTIKIDLVVDEHLSTLGFARDFERGIQDYRKKQGCKPGQNIHLKFKIEEVKDPIIFEKTMQVVDWQKLCVEVKWLSELDTEHQSNNQPDKKIIIKDFVTIVVG